MLKLTQNPIFAIRPDDTQQQLQTRTTFTRRSAKRTMVDALNRKNCVKDIQQLPEPGESLHIIARGNFPLWSIVPATIALAKSPIDHLTLATLGFSASNATDLLALIDGGQVRDVALLASVFFERQNPKEWAIMAEGLRSRGQKIAALRQHAKIICMALSDGRKIAVESSANLRSNRNIEQITIHHDATLHDFHAAWIRQVIEKGTK